MRFVIWVHSYHLKVFIVVITKISCLYTHVDFAPLRAVLVQAVSSDAPGDGGQVYEAGLVYIQMLLPALSQSSQRTDESATGCSWHILGHLALSAEPEAAQMHEQDGETVPAVPVPVWTAWDMRGNDK